MATDVAPIREQGGTAERAWRATATTAVLVVGAATILPVVAYGFMERSFPFPWPARWVLASVYGPLLVALLIPRRHYRWRATILLSGLYVLAAEQLVLTGLVGHGRILLLLLPPLAVVLLGLPEGWVAVAVTTLMLAAFTVLAGNTNLLRWRIVHENSVNPGFWLLQGLMLLAALIPLMVLLTRFVALQMRTATAERQARRKLEHETAMRRDLEKEILRVAEDERRRLGAELHDGVCQHLTAVQLHCAALENRLAAQNLPEAGATGHVRSMVEASIGMAYDVAKGLCPVDLDPDSLISALQRLARRAQNAAGVACEFRSDGPVAVSDPQNAQHLYRIAQEAVGNAVKHARCRRIQVELLGLADSLTLRIRDDGIGNRSAGETTVGGMGVRLMAHRADIMGGTLTIEHPTGGGTVVTCRVPDEAAKGKSA